MKRVICAILALAMVLVSASAFAEYAQMEKGAKGEAVSALQTRLKELGFYSIAVDGDYGNGTVNAIKAFEEYNGLTPTGIASVELQTLLFSDEAKGIPVPDVDIVEVGMKQNYGSYYAYPKFTNNTESTIDAVTIMIKWYNPYGERMMNEPLKLADAIFDYYKPIYGLSYEWGTLDISGIKIAPGKSFKIKGSQEIFLESAVPHNSISLVKMAVVRYRTEDGSIVSIPENEQCWRGSDGSLETIEFENNLQEKPEMTSEMTEIAGSFRLGITVYPVGNFVAKDFGLPVGGAYIDIVDENSIAEYAGIKPGDVILKIGDLYVVDGDDIEIAKGLMNDTDPVDVLYYRNGQECHTEFTMQ